jgi:hypothetical protein
MNVVGAIPPNKVDWGFRPDKFTLGDLVRHIAASNAYIFLEVAKGNRSSYHGCGKEYGESYDEIVAFTERLHREAIETLSHFTTEDLQRRCTTPDGASVPVWKWLRSMVARNPSSRPDLYLSFAARIAGSADLRTHFRASLRAQHSELLNHPAHPGS